MSRPCRMAAVTFHWPARSVFCSVASTALPARASAMPHSLPERIGEAAEIARRVVHVGLGDLDIVEGHDRIEGDRPAVGGLPHDLAMDLALGGNVDDDIAAELRLAAEAPAGFQRAADVGVALLHPVPRR